MDTSHPDILIHGAGPVGCALALLLARQARDPGRIALVLPPAPNTTAGQTPASQPTASRPAGATDTSSPADDTAAADASGATHTAVAAAASARPATSAADRRANAQDQTQSNPHDPRALALNHGSRALLESLQAWPGATADIQTVHVSQRHRLGRSLIRHQDLGVPRLGSVVGYDPLLNALRQAVDQQGIRLLPAEQGDPATHPARLHVLSDGRRAQGLQRTYGQHALLATVRAARPMPGWAFERFTDYGPLALLPHPDGQGLYSLVWCAAPPRAAALQAQGQAAFGHTLRDAFGDRLGALHGIGQRAVFPLVLDAGTQRIGLRTIAIGNAAQTLHPVAGQGLNLALRDAAQLAHALSPWLRDPAVDPASTLDGYVDTRRLDRWVTIGITDLLPRVFSTRNPLVEHACGAGLLTLDLFPPARDALARQLLMGTRA